jgi:hypothetical protein
VTFLPTPDHRSNAVSEGEAMMVKCGQCGAAWTSLGMTLCPICGAKVQKPAGLSESGRHERVPAPQPLKTAVVSIPRDLGMEVPQMGGALQEPTRVHAPVPPPPKAVEPPVAPPLPDVKKLLESDFGFEKIPAKPARVEDDSWYCSLPAIPPAPKPAEPRAHLPIRSVPAQECTAETERVDASVLMPAPRPEPRLPAPARPLSAPLVLGIVAAATGLLLPLTLALESNRIFGILGFCVCGLLLPMAPVAWIAGLAAERRRREQGLRAERRVVVGRLLGQWGTVLLAAEGTIGFLVVAGLRVLGRFPISLGSP